jgi:flagellar motility protein MotE (MotC chaperone)
MNIHAPRLLPATIAMLSVVLVVKTGLLVRSAVVSGEPAALVAVARAGGTEAVEKPAEAGKSAKSAPTLETKSAGADPQRVEDKQPPRDTAPPMTDGEKTILMQLRERRQELESREAALAARESLLAATDRKLAERVDELQSLQKKLESLDASHKQQEDTAWQGLVKVYETMKPRDAATIFNDLGMPVLLSVLDRMKEAKAAAILAAMAPDKARDVTMQLASSRTRGAMVTGGNTTPALDAGKARGPGT